MGASRDAINAIKEDTTGKLLELAIREDERTDEENQLAFNGVTNEAVWEAIYTLANHIDSLREGRG